MMVMNLALAAYVLGGPGAGGALPLWETFGRWTQLAASAVLLAYPGQDFFAGAFRDLRRKRAGMDVPIVLGLLVAWAGSAWATFRGAGPVYFDAIAMLVFFVLLARAFETRARLSAAAIFDRFAVVQPTTATRVGADGLESEVAALDLRPGDVIRVSTGRDRPGRRNPSRRLVELRRGGPDGRAMAAAAKGRRRSRGGRPQLRSDRF